MIQSFEERWCKQQNVRVENYLRSQGVEHGRVGEWPAWHVVPYVAVWAIESRVRPGSIGWWAISGDLPTDYVTAADLSLPSTQERPLKHLRIVV